MRAHVVAAMLAACGGASQAPTTTPPQSSSTQAVPLPGATGPVTVDFIAYEPARDRVWIPVGETGSVDVFDVASRTFARVDGFKTKEREAHGRKRMMGPSSVTFGDGLAFVGDRASNEVCAIDVATLKLGACVTLESAPDAVAWVAATHEVWATTPKDTSITIIEGAATPRVKGKIATGGEPEAYAIDGSTFYTNYEDKNATVGIDVASHEIKTTWPLQCSDGPRGLAFDPRGLVVVACTDGIEVLKGGRVAGKLDVGAGVDLIDMSGGDVWVASSKTSRLVVAHVEDDGTARSVATIATSPGVRNPVVGAHGKAFAVDPEHGTLVMLK
jgi:DNA-binding beta-propeller fold protein YncE